MVQRVGTLTSAGELTTQDIFRYEHHKFIIKVTNFVSTVTISINDNTLGEKVNLDRDNKVYKLTENTTYSFLCENQRMDEALIDFMSGDATLEVYYIGW